MLISGPSSASPSLTSPLCEVLVFLALLLCYVDIVHGSWAHFLLHLHKRSREASARLNIKPGDKCPRRRRVEKVSFGPLGYPSVFIRRVPDNTIFEEHSAPYRVTTERASASASVTAPSGSSSASTSTSATATATATASDATTTTTTTTSSLLVRDPHRWLEDSGSERTLAWLEAQQDFTNTCLQKLVDKETLLAFQCRVRDSSFYQEKAVIFQRGALFFYLSRFQSHQMRLEPGQREDDAQFKLYVTSDLALDGDLLLDAARLANDDDAPSSSSSKSSSIIQGTWVSSDGLRMVYGFTTEATGPWMTLRVRDCITGKDCPVEVDVITGVCHVATTSVEWLDRAAGFFYSCYSEPPDPETGILPATATHRICFHRLGTTQSQDLVVYQGETLENSGRFLGEGRKGLVIEEPVEATAASSAALSSAASSATFGGSPKSRLSVQLEEDEKEDPDSNATPPDDDSDADSGLGSDTWNDGQMDEDGAFEGEELGYVEWAGRRESYRPRVSVDGRYLLIEIYLDGNDAGKGVDDVMPDSSRSSHCNKLYYFDLSSFHGESTQALGQCVKLIDAFDSRWEYVTSIEEDLWMRTNYLAPNFRIMRISLPDLDIFESVSRRYLAGVLRSIWMYALEWIPESVDGSALDAAGIAAHTVLVLKYLRDASHTLLLYDLTQTLEVSSQRHIAELPNIRHCDIEGPFCHFQSPNIFYRCSGFAEPGCIFRTTIIRNVFSGAIELQFEPAFTTTFPSGLQLYAFETRQDFCKTLVRGGSSRSSQALSMMATFRNVGAVCADEGDDGPANTIVTDLPMYIFAPRDTSDQRPCILYIYGGFGVSVTPSFCLPLFMFVKHFDAILCVVNARGGGEMGADWHADAMGPNKQHGVDDVISAAEYLIESGYTTKERLGLMGGACGGLLIGACITQRPDLFACAVVEDGLFDLMRHHLLTPPAALQQGGPCYPAFHLDEGKDNDPEVDFVPLWSAEFGCAAEGALHDVAARLLKLSPLHNIRAPAIAPPASATGRRRSSATSGGSSSRPGSISSTTAPPVIASARKLFPAVLLVTNTEEEAAVPPAHSYKFVSELQRVCGARERANPILIYNSSQHTWADEVRLTREEKRLQLVSKMLCFMAKHIDATLQHCEDGDDNDDEAAGDKDGNDVL